MVHIPSAAIHQEILKTPHLIRLTEAHGDVADELTLIIKCNSLLLKYVLQGSRTELWVFQAGGGTLCYAFRIWDDAKAPVAFWSAALNSRELELFNRLVSEGRVVAHLFNEACTNVASAVLLAEGGRSVSKLVASGHPLTGDISALTSEVDDLLNELSTGSMDVIGLTLIGHWQIIRASYITNGFGVSEINFFGANEGEQQEELIRWLADGLHPTGAIHRPQVQEPSGSKELTDVLLTYEKGAIIFESKTLSLSSRKVVPDRDKLKRDTIKDIRDAVGRQLRTACRKIKADEPIFDKVSGAPINIDRQWPVQAICLVPDLSLIRGCPEFGRLLLTAFAKRTGCYLHLLDTTQLFRMVQAAHMLSESSESITRMMAFDGYLLTRFEFAVTIDEAAFDMTLNLRSEAGQIRFSY